MDSVSSSQADPPESTEPQDVSQPQSTPERASSHEKNTQKSAPDASSESDQSASNRDAMESACSWLSLNDKSDRYVLIMGIAGNTSDIAASTRALSQIEETAGGETSVAELERDILTVVFSGLDPTDLDGVDLIAKLYGSSDLESAGLLENAFALICYDSNHFDIPQSAPQSRSVLLHRILSYQQEDGGFSPDSASSSDIRSTCAALTALGAYQDEEAVSSCVQSALSFLQKAQQKDGMFCLGSETPNTSDLCRVVIALGSLGVSPDDSRFSQQGETPLSVLLSCQQQNGGFAPTDEAEADVVTTELAVCALTAMENQTSPFILQSSVSYSSDHQNLLSLWWILPAVFLVIAAVFVTIFLRRKRKKKLQGPSEREHKDELR